MSKPKKKNAPNQTLLGFLKSTIAVETEFKPSPFASICKKRSEINGEFYVCKTAEKTLTYN